MYQFEGVACERKVDWNFAQASLQGSSFYKLQKILQWFSGNIGFHYIHHLNPHIPNYNLEYCHNATPLFRAVMPITLGTSSKSLKFHLWDEAIRAWSVSVISSRCGMKRESMSDFTHL